MAGGEIARGAVVAPSTHEDGRIGGWSAVSVGRRWGVGPVVTATTHGIRRAARCCGFDVVGGGAVEGSRRDDDAGEGLRWFSDAVDRGLGR